VADAWAAKAGELGFARSATITRMLDLLGRTWDQTQGPAPQAWAGWPPPPPPVPAFKLPELPPLGGTTLTVDDAWAIFGIPQKRAQEADVRRRYIAFLAKWHPDRHPEDQATATAQFVRAKAAWELLQKHCRWGT
jgi:DnaJ domain